ncbi:hypothetical protein [Christiangramia aestuarii]|nr:hypothetical protein [Christiangramia aestuarii]
MQFRILHYESFLPLAEISKYQHMWSFFGRSYNYNIFIGLIELLIGILIVFRRTRLMALLLSLGVCLNILILNLEFEVFFAVPHIILDFLLTLLLLAEYRKDIYQFFIANGGKFSNNLQKSKNGFIRILPFLYVIILTTGYALYAYNLKATVNDNLTGSYSIENLKINGSAIELTTGKLGSEPMLFFEHNRQAVFSINDSIYFGAYTSKHENISMYFNPPLQEIKRIKGKIEKDNSIIKGIANDSISVRIEIERLSMEQDYLNNLYN